MRTSPPALRESWLQAISILCLAPLVAGVAGVAGAAGAAGRQAPQTTTPVQSSPAQGTSAQEPVLPDPGGLLGPGRGLELTLEAAIELALQNDLGLKIEALSSDIARYGLRGSYGAFDWIFGARAGVIDREGPPQSTFGGENSSTQEFSIDLSKPLATTGGNFAAHFDTNNTDSNLTTQTVPDVATRDLVSLSYTQPLLRGGWGRYATSVQREADFEYRRQLERQREIRQRVIRDASNAYWDVVSTREQLEVAEASLRLAREQVDQNQRRLDAGVGTEVEVLQAEADVATREERRLNAEVRTQQSSDALKQLVFPGTDEAAWETSLVPLTALPDAVAPATAPPWTAALALAIESRAELRQQRALIDAVGERHLRRKNERDPALDLELSASGEGFSGDSQEAFESSIQYDFPTYRAALVFNYPIGNRTARYGEKAARAELRAARLAYDQLESRIVGEVREAVRQVVYQAEAVRAARKSQELAQRQLEAEQARYQEQLSTTFQVLVFQQDLAQAQSSERAARANYAKALVALQAAQGLLGERPAR